MTSPSPPSPQPNGARPAQTITHLAQQPWSWHAEVKRPLPGSEAVRDLPVDVFDTIDSTSLHARRWLEEQGDAALASPRMFMANQQTGGVGRFGRPWSSPRGGLWCTLVWPIHDPAQDSAGILNGLGIRVGVAVWETISAAVRNRWSEGSVTIKWPNDVLIDGRKVAGILTEVTRQRTSDGRSVPVVLVGVGINANFRRDQLPAELAKPATTLREELGIEVDVRRLYDGLVRRLHNAMTGQGLDKVTLMTARRQLHGVGKPITVTLPDGKVLEGAVVGLTDAGALVLRTAGGERVIPSGSEVANGPAPSA